MSFLSHLECGYCEKHLDADKTWNLCPECNKPLLAQYDLAAARQAMPRNKLVDREPNLWRYHELLPVRDVPSPLRIGPGYSSVGG